MWMTNPERPSWLRRDGGPLAVSLVLHVLLLILIAPGLVMRTIPAPQLTVEVMLEPPEATKQRKHPEKAARARTPRPRQALKPVPVKTLQVQLEVQPVDTSGSDKPGRSGARAEAEAGSLSQPQPGAAAPSVNPAQQLAGITALGRNPTAPSPLAPSLGSTPQPSAAASPAAPRPGEDRQDGPLNLVGPVPQAQAVLPEFRQAARLGGTQTLRGGSRTPGEGLARQSGSLDNTALQAALAAPQTLPGRAGPGGGSSPAVAAPAANSIGRAGMAAGEGAVAASNRLVGAAGGQSALPVAVGSQSGGQPNGGAGSAGRASVAAGEGAAATAAGGKALGVVSGQGAAPAAASGQSGGTLSAAGRGAGGTADAPGERGTRLLAAASGEAAGPSRGGPGQGDSGLGEGRAAALAGAGLEGRDAGRLQTATESGYGDASPREAGYAQLSAATLTRTGAQALTEAQRMAMQAQEAQGTARVIEERFTATALKVDSPRHVCDLPLMVAGLDRRPIPPGLDIINATAGTTLAGETPPRHHPSNQQPRYPLQALGTRSEGRVVVRAEIKTDGLVGRVLIKQPSGAAVLDQAALATVQGWRFYPARRNGMAVAMWLNVPIEYKTP